MPSIELSTGVRLFYAEEGAGRPVVFLHGWAMSGRVWHFQAPLADDCRLVCPDLRGHGQSDVAGSYTVEDFAADLVALFRQLDLQNAVLVGWSMGVQVALQAFSELRERVAALVLVGGTPRFTTADDFPHGKEPVEVKGMGVRLRRDHRKTMGEFFRGMFVEGEMDSRQYQRIVHEIVLSSHSPTLESALNSLSILSTVDLRDRLPQVDRPVLLIHGAGDNVVPASASAYMAKRLPDATLKVMEGCGHAPFMTRPDEFNRLVRDFMAHL
ncbi:alpha/beta fold hydrolase [Geomesophilobacter sediminis]|uniref:Alpha/beta fold hydrolase n=1 Tax=Geomesophilobacter sediminis TaxID=2798584 RepID=A0A8J7JMH1_9BACT|nr:alpha/beta fold hydrolase [Geomesophilobacter sediminis]MBJ6725970.1 alpha/beta fold hydrolase [Geomesophilobacter sediminis]